MGKELDLSGQRFGKLTVVSRSEKDKWGSYLWLCACDCGKTIKIKGSKLKSGGTKTCGCNRREIFHDKHCIDLTGQRFGRLLVIEKMPLEKGKKKTSTKWLCECDCGNKTITSTNGLRQGKAQSCGCYGRDRTKETNTTHGGSALDSIYKKEFRTWVRLHRKINNKRDNRYSYYGGRGIKIAERWQGKTGFQNFLEDMGPCPGPEYSIERIDVNGDYCPENCKWILRSEQANNKTNTKWIEFNGERRNMKQWAKHLGIDYQVLAARLNKLKWPIEKALTTPVRKTTLNP